MKPLAQLCKPRPSVFDLTRRDTVLDLTDLVQDRIDPNAFFEENFLTDGMKRLVQEAFRRFDGKSAQGVFKLSQAMGGGKTHNMLVLGLLARHPELRARVIGQAFPVPQTGRVRVVAFSGRESDAPLGIWGELASQLGRKDLFKDYYSPLAAPGQSAWVNLLKGEPLLILLDELPPYLQNARATAIGNSDLAEVTTTALSNLLVAVGKDELHNVAVVISDLRANYEAGSQQLNKALNNLEGEVGRSALSLEPVGMNTDELYHILRKRLFTGLPNASEIAEVAQGYAQAIRNAKQMDITNASPEKTATAIVESYPFHPSIRDLYARFRENPGFQQTRGLIRLMRTVVARMFSGEDGAASRRLLIAAHDLDLNDPDTLGEIRTINPTLENAISHDIASAGRAVAEIVDANLGGTDAQDACRLLLVASLANVPNALLGLSLPEVVSYLCEPGRDLARLPKDVLGTLTTKAWYLHSSREGKLFFKNVQNLVAKLKTTAESYNREQAMKELRQRLATIFEPSRRDCYQAVAVLPAVDALEVGQDKVTLVIYEPSATGRLHPDLERFYQELDFKNRILFLSGERGNLENLLEVAAELRAIHAILEEMRGDRVPDNDAQMLAARDLAEKIQLRLLSATRETFTKLTYPFGTGLLGADFMMQYRDNEYRGEDQIRETLKAKQKFTDDLESDTFRRKCEERLFTQKSLPWAEVRKRAATNIKWQWHHPDALDKLKGDLVFKDFWREQGEYVEKGPFAKPSTSVQVQLVRRDDETGEVRLKLIPQNGDTLHYELGGDRATTGSSQVTDPKEFRSTDLRFSFLCVDSTGEHQTGDPVTWSNFITLRHRLYRRGNDRMLELRSAPNVPIRYSTDGSDPRISGGAYDGPFVIPIGTLCVLAVAEKEGVVSDPAPYRIDIDWSDETGFKLDLTKPARWKALHDLKTTKDTYEFLARARRHGAVLSGVRIEVTAMKWTRFDADERLELSPEQVERALGLFRDLVPDGEVGLETSLLRFERGQQLADWVAEVRRDLQAGEVLQ